jgi:SRSO17 transposase
LQLPLAEGWAQWLLLRWSISDPIDITIYVCFAPEMTTLEVLVQVAGRRWTVEVCFEGAKGEVGLDHYGTPPDHRTTGDGCSWLAL